MIRNRSKNIIMIIALIICLFTTSTIAYSAISSTMNIKGIAKARIQVDTRITNFQINKTESSTSTYEEFTKDKLLFNLIMPTETSSATYEIELTNYGANEAGLYSIEGIPDYLSYEITNYNLKDKICNNETCTLGAKKTIYLTIQYKDYNENNISHELTLNFNFQPFYKVNYSSISVESSPNSIIGTDTLYAKIDSNIKYIDVQMGDTYLGLNEYTYSNGNITIPNVTGNILITKSNIVENYEYTGDYQIFTAPKDGIYKIELWGASGGESWLLNNDTYRGGYGGYTSGEIKLLSGEQLYVYVGGKGARCECREKNCCGENGGYNGGGKSYQYYGGHTYYGSGGGATDIRYFETTPTQDDLLWNSFLGLNSRIMVAAGGGGASNWQEDTEKGYNVIGGSAGGLESSLGIKLRVDRNNECTVATQTSAGTGQYNTFSTFGQGGSPIDLYGPGGGGGYFGGGSTETNTSGGSSYISGHLGCVSLLSSTSRSFKENCITGNTSIDCATHYSNKTFSNTTMIDGTSYNWSNIKDTQTSMPNPVKGNYPEGQGQQGNGYARITLKQDLIGQDLSGNNNNPTLNSITISSEGAVFNGNGSTIEFPTTHGVTLPATYSITFQTKETVQQVLFGDAKTKAGFGFVNNLGEVIVNIGNGNSYTLKFIISPLELNKTYTFDLLYETTIANVRLFINGQEITERGEKNYWIWDSKQSFIGKRADSVNYPGYFNGTLERFLVYNDALTVDEIIQNYNATNSNDIIKDNLKIFYNFK